MRYITDRSEGDRTFHIEASGLTYGLRLQLVLRAGSMEQRQHRSAVEPARQRRSSD
jgi:hypothetical protein